MSNLTDFFPSGGGGGLTPKFEEFNSSGTFTPSQALIDAGGYIEVFLVGGGSYRDETAGGGEVLIKKMYLTSISACSVTLGAGGQSNNTPGGSSSFNSSSAGGQNITAIGGTTSGQNNTVSPSWGARQYQSAGNGIFGYGAGGSWIGYGGARTAKANTGQGSSYSAGGSGYCLIKWYE